MDKYKTIKQIIETPESHDFMSDADKALNAFVSEGWTVDSMFYRQWNDGPDFFVERIVTLKRETSAPVQAPVLPRYTDDLAMLVAAAQIADNEHEMSDVRWQTSHDIFRHHVYRLLRRMGRDTTAEMEKILSGGVGDES